MSFAQLVVIYALLIVVQGYWLSRAMKTWRLRASFFLTLFAVAVIGHSLLGVAATALPAIVSIVFFEREQMKRKDVSRHKESRNEKFAEFSVRKWDARTPLVVFDSGHYFFDKDAVYDYIAGKPADETIRICVCRLVFLEPVAQEDLLMGRGGGLQLPDNVQQALDALNEEIEHCDPVSWEQADIAVDIADLRERARRRVANSRKERAS